MYISKPDILIVEDEEFNRDIIALRLEPCHYNLRFAVNGQQALDVIAEKKPDIVLLDIMLPEIMGLQVLHTLRQQYSMVDLPIIMVTAVDEDQRMVRALELGANDYINKPINFPILIARLQTQISLKQLSALNNEFLTTASYDLRKPLSLIQDIVSTSGLKLSTGQDFSIKDIQRQFTSIGKSANYIQSITDCILGAQAGGFAEIRLTKIPLQADTLIAEVINRHVAYASKKGINLVSKLAENIPTVEVDRNRIAQVLDNLVSNAIKFCSANDTVTISTKANESSLSIIVSDTGPGIKDSEFDQLFAKNTRLSNQPTNKEPNPGLGLAICKQLIDLHEGEIGAMNNSDKGISFWFRLPVFKLRPV